MIPNARQAGILLVLSSLLLSAGCQTRDTGPSRESFMGGMRDQNAKSPGESARPAASTPRRAPEQPSRTTETPRPAGPVARGPAIPDTRVMLYQPKGDLLLILVNEGHSARATEEGRINLALGEANRAYKVLSDGQMTALLQSLAAAELRRDRGRVRQGRRAVPFEVLGRSPPLPGDHLGRARRGKIQGPRLPEVVGE